MLSALQQRKLLHLFHVFDADKNGVVDVNDFHLVISRFAALRGWSEEDPRFQKLRTLYLHQWQALAVGAEPPGSGQIHLEGWYALWNAIIQADYEGEVVNVCEALFRAMDVHGLGRFTLAESRSWFRAYGLDPAEADAVFPICDLNSDGWLSKDEWLILVDQFFYSDKPDAPGNLLFGRLPGGTT